MASPIYHLGRVQLRAAASAIRTAYVTLCSQNDDAIDKFNDRHDALDEVDVGPSFFEPRGWRRTGRRFEAKDVEKFLPPLPPDVAGKLPIVGIGLNYAEHVKEAGMGDLPKMPIVFLKMPGALAAHGQRVTLPEVCAYKEQIDYEAELAVVIGRSCRNVSESDALNYVFGYAPANDVSARDWQLDKDRCGGQWVRSKSFDAFAPLGPFVTVKEMPMIRNIQHLNIMCRVNGRTLQNSNTKHMLFGVAKLVSFLSQGTTLPPGTVILTGTPEGVAMKRTPSPWLKHNDIAEVSIEGLGTLRNIFVDEKSATSSSKL